MLDEIFLITLPFISYEEGLDMSCLGGSFPCINLHLSIKGIFIVSLSNMFCWSRILGFPFFPKPQSISYPSSPLKCLGSLWIHQDAISFSFVEMLCLTFFVAPNNKIWCFLSAQATVSNIIWTPSQINETLPYISISIHCKNTTAGTVITTYCLSTVFGPEIRAMLTWETLFPLWC